MSKENFVKLAKAYEAKVQELYGEGGLLEQLTAAMKEVGIDQYAQDPETGAVYKVIKPLGTYTFYREIDYKRTALDGERGGTVLSKKEAQEAGFVLSK